MHILSLRCSGKLNSAKALPDSVCIGMMAPLGFIIHNRLSRASFEATKEWKPNFHAHIVFDCTCREHRLVERPAKFSKEMKSKNGKPPTKLIDNYGKIVRLSKADMSRMQDLAGIHRHRNGTRCSQRQGTS